MFSVTRERWYLWIAIGAISGAACASMMTNYNESASTSRSMSQREFEDLLLRPSLVDSQGRLRPWISNIVVNPPRAVSDDYDCSATQSISFDAYLVQDEEKHTFRLLSFDLIVKVPYEPKPLNDAGVHEGATYPGVSLYKARADDTLDSIMSHEYGGISAERRTAIIAANDLLRRATKGVELEIQPDRIYYIPPDPATNPTIVQFLQEASVWVAAQTQQQHIPIAFRFTWWELPKYAWPISMASGLGLFGFVVPTIAYLLGGGSRPPTVDESFPRFRHRKKQKKPSTAEMSPQDSKKLETVISTLSAFSQSGNDYINVASNKEAPQAASQEPRKFIGIIESVENTPSPTESKSYKGEFYPVVSRAETPKPACADEKVKTD